MHWLISCKNGFDIWALEGVSEEKRTEELRTLLNDLQDKADFVVIDTKGSAGLSTSAAVLKSDLVCVPLQPSASDLWPIENVLSSNKLSQEARGGKPNAFLILYQTDDVDVLARDVRSLGETVWYPDGENKRQTLTGVSRCSRIKTIRNTPHRSPGTKSR